MSLTYYPRYVLWVPFRRAFIASVYISFLNHHLLADWASAFYSPCLTSSLNTVNFVLFSVYSGGMSELCPTVEKEMATHSSTLGWKIPWMEEPGGLQSMRSLRVRHDWATSLSLFIFHALEKEMATHSSVLAWRIPGTGDWWAAVYGVAQSRTRLKRLSSSSTTWEAPVFCNKCYCW